MEWPIDEAERVELAGRRIPRLLLIDARANPPHCTDVIEDWIRMPADRADIDARVQGLRARAQQLMPQLPIFDTDGRVRFREANAHVSRLQERLLSPLIEQFGVVVSRETLIESGWGGGETDRNTLDVQIVRLRRRIAPLGLEIGTVRSRGYLLTSRGRGR